MSFVVVCHDGRKDGGGRRSTKMEGGGDQRTCREGKDKEDARAGDEAREERLKRNGGCR